MNEIHITDEMRRMIHSPSTKQVWLSEIQSANPCECKNCGGAGYLYLFVADKGPFPKPPPLGVSKFDGQRWWVGHTLAYLCPDCQNLKPPPEETVQWQDKYD